MVLSKKNKNLYFDAQAYVNRMLEERTNAALEQKNAQFAQEHDGDTGEELLDYVVQCAEKLKHTPHVDEVIGGRFIASRFGSWNYLLAKTDLPPLGRKCPLNGRKIYQEELRRQAALYRQAKQERKQARMERGKQSCRPMWNAP